jgi:hypothetical protein
MHVTLLSSANVLDMLTFSFVTAKRGPVLTLRQRKPFIIFSFSSCIEQGCTDFTKNKNVEATTKL